MGKNRIRTILALAMVLAMLSAGVPGAFADVELGDVTSIYISVDNEMSYKVDGGGVIYKEGEDKVTVGDVKQMENQNEAPVSIWAHDGGEVTVTMGDVKSVFEGDPAVVIRAGEVNSTGEIVFQGGQVTAAGDGVQTDTLAGTAEVKTGAIEAHGNGVTVNAHSYSMQGGSRGAESGDTHTTTVKVEGDVNVVSSVDGAGVKAVTYRDGESASVTVNGDITVDAEPGSTWDELQGVELKAAQGELTGSVNGDIIIGEGGKAAVGTAVYADASGRAVLDVTGDVTITAREYSCGIITADTWRDLGHPVKTEGDTSVTVSGELSVTSKGIADGVYAHQEGEGKTEVFVGNGITAEVTSDYGDAATGILASAANAEAEVNITVEDGGVKAAGNEDSVGVFTNSVDGTIGVSVGGGVESSGTGLRLWADSGATNVAITGDVVAGMTAVEADVAIEGSAMDVIVDGTVTGGGHAIVVSEGTVGNDLTMTVWKVTPNEDGSVAERMSADGTTFTEDETLEKQIQYIIRIDDSSKDYLATSGTTDYEGYQVAHEGDTVLVKLTLPEGKELAAAYWDEEQTEAGRLLQDGEGNYYVEVPRGGGVVLSLILQDAPEEPEDPVDPIDPEDPEDPAASAGPAESTGAAAAKQAPVILTIRDTTGKTEIAFRADGRFEAKYEDGSVEKGTFRLADGQVVLANSKGHEMPVSKDGGGFKLVYTAGTGAGDFEFLLGEPDVQILVDALS